MTSRPTTAAVVALAAEQRARADRIINPDSPVHDPYARPPYPTTAAARMEVSRQRGRLRRELDARCQADSREPTGDELDQLEAQAPAAALATLRWRWERWEKTRADERTDDAHRRARHVRRQRAAARDRSQELAGLSVGQRIDRALAQITTVQAAKAAAAFDAPRVSGGRNDDSSPSPSGDPGAKARAIARGACEQVEEELESARRRRVEGEAA